MTRLDVRAWLKKAVADARFVWLVRGLDFTIAVEFEGAHHGIRLSADAPPRLVDDPVAPEIVISMSDAVWRAVARKDPAPGYHSFGAWLRHDVGITIKADPLCQAQALAALERLVELARPSEAGDTEGSSGELADEALIGCRGRLTTDDGDAMIHWLEAGEGPPIVFLHTAGADARQYRHQLTDPELQSRHRLLAFDMPWHGQSRGVGGIEDTTGYKLTERAYLAWTVAFLETVCRRPAIVVGCSMGAAMALTVTAERPGLIAGCIALEAPFRAPGRRSELLADARIANGWHNPAYVRALLSPTAPQRFRDEACAIYAQARPGVYMGDLAYYSDEYDGARLAASLRECGRPIALLTGSYDYSASPDNTRQLADAIGDDNLRFEEMPGLGHFPMIEHPSVFRPHLLAALDHVSSGGGG